MSSKQVPIDNVTETIEESKNFECLDERQTAFYQSFHKEVHMIIKNILPETNPMSHLSSGVKTIGSVTTVLDHSPQNESKDLASENPTNETFRTPADSDDSETSYFTLESEMHYIRNQLEFDSQIAVDNQDNHFQTSIKSQVQAFLKNEFYLRNLLDICEKDF